MKITKTIFSNKLTVTEASRGDTARHHFATEDKCREVEMHEMLMKVYKQDFVEPKSYQP